MNEKIASSLKLFLYSLTGIFFFFVPIKIGDKNTIPLDHIVTFVRTAFPEFAKFFALAVIFGGAVYPIITKKWKTGASAKIFSALKILGFLTAVMYFTKTGGEKLFEKDLLPFLFEKLVVPVGLIVPIGSIFLAFLVDFGLLELVGTLMEKIMRPLWKTPGRSAVDALASFVGSYSIALLITDKVYVEGKYSDKEAVIIATGFSTVSATFMIIVAKTLEIIEYWNFYFWSALLVTFAVTAITVRIPPISLIKEAEASNKITEEKHKNVFLRALTNGINASRNSPALAVAIKKNFLDGILMTMNILPSILSIGLIGLLLAKFTPVFDLLGYAFYPVVKMLALPDATLVSKAAAVEIAEMFLPALLIKNSELISRYVIAVTSVSAILFFSASIPTILSTRIPVKISHLIIIWFERTILSLIFAAVLGYLYF